MMMGKGKPLAALIVAKMKPKMKEGDGYDDSGVNAALDEAYAAIEKGNKGAFRTALRSAIEMCMDEPRE